MDSSCGRNRRRRKLCEHCGESLSYSAYLSHRRLYYDSSEDKWVKAQSLSEQTAAPALQDTSILPVVSLSFDSTLGKLTVVFQLATVIPNQRPIFPLTASQHVLQRKF